MLGSGTQTDPYIISTPQDLNLINNNLTAYYELANDIDMSSYGNFTPIGRVYPFFGGHLNGKGYKVSNLSIVSTVEYTAFIARTNGGIIENLGLENVYVESNNHHVGGLIALNSLSERISNCYVTGVVKQTVSSKLYAGGFIGRNYGNVNDCYSACTVIGGDSVGGFSGVINYANSIIKDCYSKSSVSGSKNVGAFFGTSEATVIYENNFYDSQIASVSNSPRTGVTGKTTTEMKQQSTYTNWNFSTVWYMEDYPSLRMFSDVPISNIEIINVNSYSLPFFANVGKSQKSAKQLNTFSNAIISDSERILATLRLPMTYLSPISTSVTKSSRSVRSSTQIVESFINPISASVERKSKTFVNLLSHIKPLQADLTILYPMNVFTPNAYVSVLENTSSVVKMENMSSVSYIVNPSFSEVIK